MFKKTLRTAGLYLDDPRLIDLNANLIYCQNFIIEHAEESEHPEYHFIDLECFKGLIASSFDFLSSAFDSNMVIADFVTFESDIKFGCLISVLLIEFVKTTKIKQLFLSTKDHQGGHVTSYTNYLSKEDPNIWSVSICSVDGQRLAFGQQNHAFTIQSIIAPFLYALAIDTYG